MSSSAVDYGLDAPLVIRNLSLTGVACVAAGVVLRILTRDFNELLATILLVWGLSAGGSMLVVALMMVRSSKVGKLRVREQVLDSLRLHGDERVLDVGCGRGLLLNGVARRLTTGQVIGIDLWRSEDQSGNTFAAAMENAQSEGTADRVKIETGDMRALAFADNQFDVVVSGLAIHNVSDTEGRAQVIREIARVLKPGGQLALIDFQAIDAYGRTLREMGWKSVSISPRNYSMFPPIRIVKGQKPSTVAERRSNRCTQWTGEGG